jgi:Uma2 family endonuclease
MVAKKVLLTAQDLFQMPDDDMRHELVKGELRTMPPAGGMHGFVAGEIFARIRSFVREHQLGYTFAAETGFVIGQNPDTVRAPDVAFVSTERLPEGGPPAFFPHVVPDLVVEVVSPYDRRREVEAKARAWLQAGACIVWVIDPVRRTGLAFEGDQVDLLSPDDVFDGKAILPGFTCRLGDLFTA